MILTILAAVSDNGVIGKGGKMPWHLPQDLKRFKATTTGHAVIMGRRTYESIGRPLPDRRNIVLTRRPSPRLPEPVLHFNSLESALQACEESGESEVFVIGGAEIYAQALPLADRMMITEVHRTVEGDVSFPPWNRAEWKQIARQDAGELSYVTYRRARPSEA